MTKAGDLFRRYRSKPVVVSSRAALIGFLLLNIVGCASSSYDACEDALKRRASASTDTMFNHARADVEKFCEPQEEWPTPYPTSTPTVMEKLDEAIRINPQDAMAYYNRGSMYRQLGQYERAIQDHDEAIRLDPQSTWAYHNRGIAYDELGQYERAIQDYDEVIRINPQNAIAYYNRGLTYAELGKSVESERDIQKAKELGYDGGS